MHMNEKNERGVLEVQENREYGGESVRYKRQLNMEMLKRNRRIRPLDSIV